MKTLLVILRSEFMRRVTSKGFILTTVLAPVLFVGFMTLVVAMSVNVIEGSEESSESLTIAVVDHTDYVLDRLLASGNLRYTLVEADSASARQGVLAGRYDGYLDIPSGERASPARFYSVERVGFSVPGELQHALQSAVRNQQMEEAGLDEEVLDIVNVYIPVRSFILDAEGEESGNPEMYGGIGSVMAFLIYFALIFYGQAIFYSVMEEKRTRVVEILMSSARSFQLLMGKVLGVGAMGLLQLCCWALVICFIYLFGGKVIGTFYDPASLGLSSGASSQEILMAAGLTMPSIPASLLIWFVLFFIAGYLLYSGLFAAVGSMVEQPQDAQGLMLPLILPLILPMVFIGPILLNPHSAIAVTLSLIPFTAPIPIVIRLAVAEIPFWQTLLSFLLMVMGILGTVWVSGRIYRTGILMYGKKVTLREAIRWLGRS